MKHFLFIPIIFFIRIAVAQTPYASHYTIEKQLPSNTVYSMHQDKKGFLWISTDDGLSRYDGFVFKKYFCSNQSSKSGSYIQEDEKGRIWYCNFDGYLFYVEHDSLKQFLSNDAPFYSRFGIYQNKLALINQDKLTIYNLSNFKKISSVKIDYAKLSAVGFVNNQITVVADSIYEYNYYGIKKLATCTKFSDSYYPSLFADFNNQHIVADLLNRKNEIWNRTQGELQKIIQFEGVKNINNISITDTIIWLCTDKGAFGYSKEFKKIYHFFPEENITQVLHDNQQNFWFSTIGNGIFQLKYLTINELKLNSKSSKLLLLKNNLLITTMNGGVLKLNLTTNELQKIAELSGGNAIYDIVEAGQTLADINELKTIDIVNTEQSTVWLANRGVKSFATINEKYIVVASSGVVSIFPIQKNGKTTDTIWDNYYKRISGYNKKNNIWEYKILKNVRAKKIVYDSISNSIFVITNLGLYQISPYKTLMPKFKNELIFATQMANSKTIQPLLLLNNGGLLQYKNKQTFKEIKGIKHPIKFIKIVANRIFTADEQHIYQAQILNDSISFTKIFSFSEPGIINDIEFNRKTNQLIISTDNGIIFKKQENENTAPDYQFYINEIHVNGNPIEQAKVVELSSNQNNIEINYSVPDYNTNTQIYYKINDADWQLLQSNTRTLSLASLSPGKYKILFKINNQTNSSEILININKPWWLSWWFLLLAAMLLLSIIFGIYKWQIEVAKQKNNLLLEKIELEKNLHNSMLASIKSQMNPHFLFNALNTIQSFIISEEKKNASNYLSKFSKLTRMILEMSERNKITLNEELQALQLYLDLEKMRFEDLETEVITAMGLHLDEIKIPSMILQPYVENSIKHGLLHKKGNRKLRITFSKMQQNLKIEIDDNGIGRKKSEELNKIKFQKHQSFSTDANLKRIELLNKEQNNIGIEYIDKPDGAGTTVVILLPLQTN